jgi:transcriptional regulator with XRE-family HTH domain
MRVEAELADTAIAQILGERIERHRIEAGLTQAELAERAGIGKRTLERIEAGRGAELVTLIRILRSLNALEGFDRLLPDLPPSPIEQLRLRGKQRKRVAHSRGPREAPEHRNNVAEGAPVKPWTWGVPPPNDAPPAKGSRPTKRKT